MKFFSRFLIAVLLVSMLYTTGHAFNAEREQRIKEQTLATLFIGEPVHLMATSHEFLALETQSGGDTKGAVILLHGRGLGPDSEIVVGPLRELLADSGWHTLSLQMPVLEKEAKYYDYVEIFDQAHPRIEAAIAHLKGQGISPVVLLAHSCSVHMSMDWIRDIDNPVIDAYIGLGMGATDYGQPMKQPFPFEKLNIPVLDVYGSDDYPAVVTKADQRWQVLKDSHASSKQITLDQADHDFTDQTDPLAQTVLQWLDSL